MTAGQRPGNALKEMKLKHPVVERPNYASAEFRLENPGIFFQFKLRTNKNDPLFAVVRKGSKALESLKQGTLIPITYHFQDRTIPAHHHATRIKAIMDGAAMGYKDHLIISLDINKEDE
jgi:hypothetical protein